MIGSLGYTHVVKWQHAYKHAKIFIYMSLQQSKARKAFWANKTEAEKIEHARKMAVTRHAQSDFKTRQEHARKMVEARKAKRIIQGTEDSQN